MSDLMQFKESAIILLPSAPNLHIKRDLHTVKLKGHSADKNNFLFSLTNNS